MDTLKPRHPKALPFLFLTEMWERFGFYVIQGLLVLYMTLSFGWSDSSAYTILGVFSALVYISPFVGGFLADKVLGFKTAILWGGLFLIIGYALLALPFAQLLFYPALATIIVGNGLFKPNISSILGTQYSSDDPRRDSGFTIFYIGINIGAFLAGASSGYIKDYFGWRMSFALASIGLVIGLITFGFGLRHFKSPPQNILYKKSKSQFLFYCLLAIAALIFLLKIEILAKWLLPTIGVMLLIFLTVLTLQQNAEYRKRLFILNILIISSIVFWMLFLQMFFSVTLFVERLTDKNFFGVHLTTTVFYASESIFIILFGPLFAWSWEALGRNDKNPSPVTKFIFGIFFTGLGFLALSCSTLFPNSTGLISPLWIFGAYALITIGELFLSPIGLSAVTLLAPPQLAGMMMGIWFVATGFGGLFAGMIAKLASIPDKTQPLTQQLAVYQDAFLDFAYFAFFVTIILFFVHLILKRVLYDTSSAPSRE